MSGTSSPYGLIPQSDQVGTIRPLRIPAGIASGLSSNIFKYQPVKMAVATGTITPVTATTDQIFGVFQGVEYTPSVNGRPIVSNFWPASATWTNTADMFVYIWPAWVPGTRWAIQADGSVAQALLGSGFNFTNLSAGSTTTGFSQATVAAAGVAASSQGQVALVEFYTGLNSTIGDLFTDLIVSIAYPQIVSGFQVSIG
jgi:hypothetical protein